MKIKYSLKRKWYLKEVPQLSFDNLRTIRAYRKALEGVFYVR